MRTLAVVGLVALMATSCVQSNNSADVAKIRKEVVDSVNTANAMARQQASIDSLKKVVALQAAPAAALTAAAATVASPAVKTVYVRERSVPARTQRIEHANSDGYAYTSGSPSVPVTQTSTQEVKKKGLNNTAKGALIGAGVGAVTGAVVAKKKVQGAVIGGVVGAAAGAGVGAVLDKKQREKLQAAANDRLFTTVLNP